MIFDLDPETLRLVDIAVAAAPPFTSDQITELRRILKPEPRIHTIPAPKRRAARTTPTRRAA